MIQKKNKNGENMSIKKDPLIKLLETKKLIIKPNDRTEFLNYIEKYSLDKIFWDYSIPFIRTEIKNENNYITLKFFSYPQSVFSPNNQFFLLTDEWEYLNGVLWQDITALFNFDKWYGNYITEILHDAELILKAAIKNLLLKRSINLNKNSNEEQIINYSFYYDSFNNPENAQILDFLFKSPQWDKLNSDDEKKFY